MSSPPPFESGPLPREKLLELGPSVLSDEELLSAMLGSGSKGRNVRQVARDVLRLMDQDGHQLEAGRIAEVRGMGPAKAVLLAAAIEFARRRIRPHGVRIAGPGDVYPLVRHIADRKQEHFVCISLNGAHEVIATRIVSIGLVNSTQVHPREVFAEPLIDRACAIIVAHNHPSGSLEPSREDLELTARLREAGTILGIRLLDHVIFTASGFTGISQLQPVRGGA